MTADPTSGRKVVALVSDGSPLLRSAVAWALERGGVTALEVERLASGVGGPAASGVDAVVLCGTAGGDQVIGQIGRLVAQGTGVLVVGQDSDAEHAVDLMLAGASGFVSADQASQSEIVEAVRNVARGRAAMHPLVAALVLQQWRRSAAAPVEPATRDLTARELDVLRAMVVGQTAQATARRMGVSLRTLHTHRSRIYVKLGVRTEAQAVAAAIDRQLVVSTDDDTRQPPS